MAKPLAMAVSIETQTALEEGEGHEYSDYTETADGLNSSKAEGCGFRKMLKNLVLLAVAVTVIVIVVYVVTVSWHGNRL